MPEKNVELARKVREHTRMYPDLLDMDTWIDKGGALDDEESHWGPVGDVENAVACGTTACFAGWTVVIAGLGVHGTSTIHNSDGTFDSVERAAVRLLGIDHMDAGRLFMCDVEDLDDVLFEIFGERI